MEFSILLYELITNINKYQKLHYTILILILIHKKDPQFLSVLVKARVKSTVELQDCKKY